MVAWMNREALARTLATGEAVYWSRSRARLWHKGEESGHVQAVHEVSFSLERGELLAKIASQREEVAQIGTRWQGPLGLVWLQRTAPPAPDRSAHAR